MVFYWFQFFHWFFICWFIMIWFIVNGKQLKPIEYHEQSLIEFKTYPDEYRESYILHHLSEEDFNRLRPRIVSICNGKYTDLDRFEFWSIYKVYNQMAFSSILYDKQTKTVLKANQPILKCDNCDKIWRAKSLEGFKNAYKVLCIDCKLCNSIFKIRPIQNVNNEKISIVTGKQIGRAHV